jgi:adenosylcobyric acid synthase
MDRRTLLWKEVQYTLQRLQNDYQQVIIEGAGSPAEINLRAGDIVNMSVALECQADVYLVSDIDRGGSFAHLLGTWACLAVDEQKLIKGFVLNKFRGDPLLLGNAMHCLEEKTGIPTVENLPYYRHQLPEEDSFRLGSQWQRGKINVALIYYPYAANLDEFDPLLYQIDVNLVPVHQNRDLTRFDALILPGSKNSDSSLTFLRTTELDKSIQQFKATGKLMLGICGGLQILGNTILDPLHIEEGDQQGLGLISLQTEICGDKSTQQRTLNWLGKRIKGYEIHNGKTIADGALESFIAANTGWQQANVYTTYVHGLFENKVFYNWFMNHIGGLENGVEWADHLDNELDKLADMFAQHGWL